MLLGAIFAFLVTYFLFDYANKSGANHKKLYRDLGHLFFCISVGLFVVSIFKHVL